MELWIPITVAAAAAQTSRNAIQRHMKGPLGDYGASAIRFIYAVPFVWIWLLILSSFSNQHLPKPESEFVIWAAIGGVTQILFTVLLIKLFSYKNFLVGVAFSKLEVLLVALMEAAFLSVTISVQFGIAIFIGIVSVMLLSLRTNKFSWEELRLSFQSKSTIIGLLAAMALATSVVSFRAALNSFPESDFLIRASVTAAIVIVVQALGLLAALYVFRRSELKAALVLWRPGMAAGFFGSISTPAWFSAFALHSAAPVLAIGQIELLFALGFTVLVFHQRLTKIELFGVLLLLSSILLVISN
ncbi:MAG: Permease of the drug/metabolite transporter (DMT) superfamily [Chloroflexi bacterium]|jgi:drug/metabolite transporter (DMT)-like permease|nr:MAG: Permease of the drug/metabolite transporter (DMT) superfamily [Chloroflexota bacterium]